MELLFGLICIIIGFLVWYFSIFKYKDESKKHNEGFDSFDDFRIYIGVIGLIILGLKLIYDFFK